MTKSVLITGASRGIGRALCAEALARGYKVHALVRDAKNAPPGTTPHLAPDIRDRAAVEKAIVALAPELTHFIANAGVEGNYNPRDPRAPEKMVEVFEINGTATAFSMAVMAREWVRLGLRDRHMAVTSSLAAGRGMAMAGPYIATKTSELCLAEGMEGDLAPYGIGVSAIRPGFIRTDLTSKNKFTMPFIMDVEKAARIIWNGLERGRFEIAFPRRMAWLAWVRDRIPYCLFRWMNRRIGRAGPPRVKP
jgi:NAD(P)-dependent dehydrogenase (short-subunit alcohol dehydrogenase family)